jgi:hypothetical protein
MRVSGMHTHRNFRFPIGDDIFRDLAERCFVLSRTSVPRSSW